MTIFESILLGVVEGITEFLPVSSTGHLVLVSEWLGIASSSFLTTFEIAIQLGAILAVVVLYGRTLLSDFGMWKKIAIAFIPTAIVGVLLYEHITILLRNPLISVLAIIIGGVVMIFVELYIAKKNKQTEEDPSATEPTLSYSQAFGVGVVQILAFIPGVSRSAATIIGGLVLGVSRQVSVEFSFLLAIPVMIAATGLDLFKQQFAFSTQEWLLLGVGIIVSFVVALAVIKLLLAYIKRFTFIPFGIYRIVFGAIILLVLF